MYFKNINIKYNIIINAIASTTLGVLCIHANSDIMRKWLWQDVVNSIGHYHDTPIHPIFSVLVIFIICSTIDLLRQKLIEKPFFNYYDKNEHKYVNQFKAIEKN